MRDVWIRGAAMTRFGRHLDRSARSLAEEAVRSVFADLYANFATGGGTDRFSREAMALVSVKNHLHGSVNQCARYPRAVTEEQVLEARPVAGALSTLMCAQLSDGAACLVLAAGSRVRRRGVRVAASVLVSGRGDDLRRPCALRRAVREACEEAGAGVEDMDLLE